jgi:hypothetical protein
VAGLTYAARQESLDRVENLWPLLMLFAPIVLTIPALSQGPLAVLIYCLLVICTAYATYLLVKRSQPGAISQAVGMLIAAVSLVDAALLAASGAVTVALFATLGFPLTLALQKYIPGT